MQSRRAFIKRLVALGVAAPLASTLPRVPLGGGLPRVAAQGDLTPRQLAGQRVIFSYAGLTVPGALLDQIRAGQAAGVLFFGDNLASAAQIAGVIAQLRQAHAQSPVSSPLLLMTDQEGGQVRRLPGAPYLSAKQIGQSADPAGAAAQAGAAAGQNLADAGMNVNLAPVLGVFRQPGNFLDQFQRSFSQNPQTVAACGSAFIAAQQRTGVAATAKHFPGLGAAAAGQNTDAEPVTLNVSLDDLRAIDEAPYPAAIDAGVALVMCSWAVYPALDANNPAGLSPAVVQGELRGRLGFRGATITDAITAGSLSAFGDIGQRSVLAAKAGMDLILGTGQDVNVGLAAASALADALQAGQLDAGEFNAAHARVLAIPTSRPDNRFFPETGHWISHGFLDYWNAFGGLQIFGYPLTEEFNDPQTGTVVQYMQRARFEWHPGADPARFNVLLGLLGTEFAQREGLLATAPFQPVNAASDANCTFFPETGHRLCFGFRDYWNTHGGLPIFGFPISEEFRDPQTGFTVQYFQRQRFEYHPENPPAWQVEGGLLGAELLPSQG